MTPAQLEADQQAYRAMKPSFLGRGIERLTNPLGSAIASAIPKSLIENVLKGIDKAVDMAPLKQPDHDPADLGASQRAAKAIARTARTLNASSGAAAGLAGAITASADIPATIALALRHIRDAGRAYGFDGAGERERLFRLQILEIAALDDHAEKISRLDALDADIAADGSLEPIATQGIEPLVDQVVERVSRAIALASVRRRMGMVVPIFGSAVGGIVNAQFQRDVGRAARYAFQARRLRALD